MKNCNNCKFAVFQDVGYSNYTVEGTTFYCGLEEHPEGSFDRFYGEDKRLEYAEVCPTFKLGESIDLDVDGENYETLSPEQKCIADRDKEAIKRFLFNKSFEDHLK